MKDTFKSAFVPFASHELKPKLPKQERLCYYFIMPKAVAV